MMMYMHNMETGKGKEENIVIVTDHFTLYVQVYVTQSQTAHMTAKCCGTTSLFIQVAWEDIVQSGGTFWKWASCQSL